MIKKNILSLTLIVTITCSITSCGLFRPNPAPAVEAVEEAPMEYADEAYFDDEEGESESTSSSICSAVRTALSGYPTFSNILEDDGEVEEWNPNIIHYETKLEVAGMEDLITEFVSDDRRICIIRKNDIPTKAEADKLYNQILKELESCVLFDPISKVTEDQTNGKLYDVVTVFNTASGQAPFVRVNVGNSFGFDGYHVIVLVRDTK